MPNKPHLQPPVSRVLIFGYYDGATDGVLQLGDGGRVYRFDWSDGVRNPDGCDARSYTLRPLPADALDRLTSILSDYHEPKWPTWFPQWQFPTPEIQNDVTARVDAILAQADEPDWEIVTSDTVTFASLEAVSVAALLPV